MFCTMLPSAREILGLYHRCPMSSRSLFVVGSMYLAIMSSPVAADKEKDAAAVGKCVSPTATLLQRSGARQAWQPVKTDAGLPPGSPLLALPAEVGAVSAGDGAVRITLHGNLPELSNSPVLES